MSIRKLPAAPTHVPTAIVRNRERLAAQIAAGLPLASNVAPRGDDADHDARELFSALKGMSGDLKNLSQERADIRARLQHVEQVVASGGGFQGAAHVPESPGELMANSDQMQELRASGRGRASMRLNAALITTDTATGGSLIAPHRVPGAVEMARRKIRIRDVLAPGRTESNLIEYVAQKTRTNAAGTVVEGALKPESAIAYEQKDAPVRTIATWIPATRQILSDAPQLMSLIDTELRYMLADVEEDQLLNGDGIGENILGLIPQATAFAAPFDPTGTETMIDMLLLAIAQNEAADYDTTFIALNPLDWRRIQLLKDADGRYLANGPFSEAQVNKLWQIPIVATKAMDVDKFLVGDGVRGAQVFDRWDSRIEVATQDQDDFIRNKVKILAEERLALVVYKPGSFILGDFGNVA